MDFLDSTTFWIIVAAGSEIIALSPAKDNGWVQVILRILKLVKKSRRIK